MILSLLGISVFADSKSKYQNNTNLSIKIGEYINSIHVLLENYPNEKFIFLGTKEAIQKHKDVFKNLIDDRNVSFEEINGNDLNSIFLSIINILIKYKDEKIIFDITHSFRDTVLMSVISTIVSQSIYNPNIEMIYAKEIERFKLYQYELVSEEILNTSNIAIILSTFLDTLRVPNLKSKYQLNSILSDFSNHLLSNQFKNIYETDIPSLKGFIQTNQSHLFFAKPLLENLNEFILEIENTKSKDNYEKFLFFTKLFYKKNYFLHSATYLIEGITYYIAFTLKQLNYIEFDVDNYANQQKIVALLKFVPSMQDFNFPNEYFIDINYKVFKKFTSLRDKVAEIRHNLAHINIHQNYGEIKKELKNLIDEYENLIKNKELFNLDKTLDKKHCTIKYKLDQYKKQLNKYSKVPNSNTKIDTFIKKYEDKKLSDLTTFEIDKLKNYLNKNYKEIRKLLDKKANYIYLVDDCKNKNISQPAKKTTNSTTKQKVNYKASGMGNNFRFNL